MPLPSYRYPNGWPIPEEAIHQPNTIIDHHAGYLLACVSLESPSKLPPQTWNTDMPQVYWEVWSVSTGRLRRYEDFAPAWGHYLRVVQAADRRR